MAEFVCAMEDVLDVETSAVTTSKKGRMMRVDESSKQLSGRDGAGWGAVAAERVNRSA